LLVDDPIVAVPVADPPPFARHVRRALYLHLPRPPAPDSEESALAARSAVRARYGKAARFLAVLPVAIASENLDVAIFDLPGPLRLYAWLSPFSGELRVMLHGGDVRSPKAAVLHAC